jgi:glycosyltransferase involved in cell wall biosynthesis
MLLFGEITQYDHYLYHLSKHAEVETLRLYDKIVTVSDVDKQKLQKEIKDKVIYSSPPMVNLPKTEIKDEYCFNNRLVFIGSTVHYPNVDGVQWFLSEVWSHVLQKNKSLELHIIGAGWNPRTLGDIRYLKQNVFFDGYVEDLAGSLLNSISIIPIRIGAGMRMKILDTVNYKIPFITTSVGVEGLDFIDGKDCLIRDNPIEFANAINELSQNQEMQRSFIKEATETLYRLYNKESLIEQRRRIYECLH